MMKTLTARQSQILHMVSDFLQEGRLPSAIRLSEELGLAGESSVTPILKALEKKGYLDIQGGIKGRPRQLSLTPKGKQAVHKPGLPILGSIPAGPLREALEQAGEFAETLKDLLPYQDGDFLLTVEGESMIGDGILPGDQVLIRPGVIPAAGEIVAVCVGSHYEATLKRLYPEPSKGKVRLVASNPDFKEQAYPAEEVKIVGVLRGVVRRHGGG